MLMSIPECEVCIDRLTKGIAATEADPEYDHRMIWHSCGTPACFGGHLLYACGIRRGLVLLVEVLPISRQMVEYVFGSPRWNRHPGTREAALDRARRVLRYAQHRLEVMTREMERVDRPASVLGAVFFGKDSDAVPVDGWLSELPAAVGRYNARLKRGPVYRFKRYRKAVAV